MSNKQHGSKRPIGQIELPGGARAFTHCAIEITKLPVFLFEMGETRKRSYAAGKRKLLMSDLIGFANADGTSCYPSYKTLSHGEKLGTGWSERQIRYYMADLVKLGWVVNGGYAWEGGPRMRRLVIPAYVVKWIEDHVIRAQQEGQIEQEGKIERAGWQDRTQQDGKIEEAGRQSIGCHQPASSLPARKNKPASEELTSASASFSPSGNGRSKESQIAKLRRKMVDDPASISTTKLQLLNLGCSEWDISRWRQEAFEQRKAQTANGRLTS